MLTMMNDIAHDERINLINFQGQRSKVQGHNEQIYVIET